MATPASSTAPKVGKRKHSSPPDHRGGDHRYDITIREKRHHQNKESVTPPAFNAGSDAPSRVDDATLREPFDAVETRTKPVSARILFSLEDDSDIDSPQSVFHNGSPPRKKAKRASTTFQAKDQEQPLRAEDFSTGDTVVIETNAAAPHSATHEEPPDLRLENQSLRAELKRLQDSQSGLKELHASEWRLASRLLRIIKAEDPTSSVYQRAHASLPNHFPLQTLPQQKPKFVPKIGMYQTEPKFPLMTTNGPLSREEYYAIHDRFHRRLKEAEERKKANAGKPRMKTVYCYCDKPASDNMVGCDGTACEREWFHFECVGITEAPAEEKWFCKDCVTVRKRQ